MTDSIKFGEYIRQKREAKGWTQPEAAAQVDIEQSYLSKLETGKSFPSDEIYTRLLDVLEIDTDEMCAVLPASDLERLKDIKEVRGAVLQRQKSKRRVVRGWLVAGLAFLMLGGGCLGFVVAQSSLDIFEFRYSSMGVIEAGESLNVFEVVDATIDEAAPNYELLRRGQQEMVDRIDQEFRTTTEYLGASFVEDDDNGRRLFELYDQRLAQESASNLRWFFIPALMFLAGSFGCFYISFRWN